MTVETLVSLAAAFGLGGVVTQAVTAAPERRRARSDVRRAVLVAERQRWLGDDADRWRAALHDVIAACLAAGIPQSLTDTYVYALRASWAIAVAGHAKNGHDRMSIEVSDYIQEVSNLMVRFLWHPWRNRLTLSRQLIRLDHERVRLVQEGQSAGPPDSGHGGGYLWVNYWDQ